MGEPKEPDELAAVGVADKLDSGVLRDVEVEAEAEAEVKPLLFDPPEDAPPFSTKPGVAPGSATWTSVRVNVPSGLTVR